MKRPGIGGAALVGAILLLVARPGRAQTPPPPAYAYPPPPPTVGQPAPLAVGPRLVLRSDSPNARLQQHTLLRWRDVCLAPCGVMVDPSGLYRIGGGTTRASDTFQLPRASGDVIVDVQAGSTVKHWVGLGLMIGGAVAAAYGIAMWQLLGSVSDDPYAPEATSAKDVGRTLAITGIAIAVVLEAVGIPMWFSHTSIQVR